MVIYVNGVEVFQNFMPGGSIAFNILASFSQDNGMAPQIFELPGSAFVAGKNVIAVEVHQHKVLDSDMTFALEIEANDEGTPADETAPTALSLNRHNPATETTDASSVTFRTTFSEDVSGVDASDFELAGTSSGTIATVAAISGTTYDITVNGIATNGTLGWNLKSSGTGIADAAANPISGGING